MSNVKSAFKTSAIVSKDGTEISYKSIGKGPGLIIVHGALSDSGDFAKLAEELSDSFTVHVIDRRGHGRSGPQGPEYSMEKEIEDLQMIKQVTGASFLFGHSYGGLVSLQFARLEPSVTRLAVYEPGVCIETTNWDWLDDYERAMDKNDSRAAFASFVRGSGHTPLTRLPMWYAKFILSIMVRGERWDKIQRLLPENLKEHREVRRFQALYSQYREIGAGTLLMAGGKSPNTIKEMIQTLNHTIAESQAVVFPQLDHFGPDNKNAPAEIAIQIKRNFLS
ncbi:alpha/beta fold hydrolase [Paenibacillus pedocola]|uniref:alpha/beta fold hydrolase n=1 Tax=Paenibacillus pedocola TaxID=3242193 RepID=UPI0028776B6F|nr:alpha/beta hydrolase [Paenibacillus typhae]